MARGAERFKLGILSTGIAINKLQERIMVDVRILWQAALIFTPQAEKKLQFWSGPNLILYPICHNIISVKESRSKEYILTTMKVYF